MSAWEKIQRLVYRPDFFAQRNFKLKSGLRFYALLILIFVGLHILFAMPGTVRFFHTLFSGTWEEQVRIVKTVFPEELNITVTKGAVSTNQTEPYALPLPLEWRSTEADMPENLLVINTTKSIETSDFAKYDTAIIVSEYGFGFRNLEKGEFRIYDTREHGWNDTFSIDKSGYDAFITKAAHALRIALVVLIALLPFFLYGLFFVGILVYLLFGALVVWLAAKVRNWPLRYGEAYVAAMYLLPIPLLYNISFDILPGNYHGLPFAFSFILFLMALINFPKITPAVPEATVTPVVTAESVTSPSIEEEKK